MGEYEKMINELSQKDGIRLLKAARQSILSQFENDAQERSQFKKKFYNDIFKQKRGSFVSLHKKGQLRGCIGNLNPDKELLDSIVENAKLAAFNDSRFNPVLQDEMEETVIEISILTPMKELVYKDSKELITKLKKNIDGVMIKKGYQSATFLPQVWKQLKTTQSFLSHLCMKAGLSSDEWQTGSLTVFVYQVQSFEEEL